MYKLDFRIWEDLKECVDSLLMESGTVIATLKIGEYILSLEVVGDVKIVYKDEAYYSCNDFTQELEDIIKGGCYWDVPELYIENNNWYNLTFSGEHLLSETVCENCDGIYNSYHIDDNTVDVDVSQETESSLLEIMIETLNHYKEIEEGRGK